MPYTGIMKFKLIILLIVFFCTCQKKPSLYEVASKGCYVEWHIQTHDSTEIVIEGWGTAQIAYKDTIYRMDSYNGNRNILGLPYDTWIFDHCQWEFIGYGVTQFHNDIINNN
jgi:hypothetical protein